MTTHASRRGPVSTRDARSDATSLTRRLLACGIIAGPLYLVVGFAQAFLRPPSTPHTTTSACSPTATSAGSKSPT